jgi:glycosyltransferase involved in cell wall biosynthesis
MKICLIGDFSDDLDEGLKNISHYLFNSLTDVCDLNIIKINIKKMYSLKSLKTMKRFKPDIIHYIPGPTNKSIFLLGVIIIYLGYKPKIILSASYPRLDNFSLKMSKLIISHVFTSSAKFKKKLDAHKLPSSLVPNGIDITKFNAVTNEKKRELREKYGLDANKFTLLHVGHIKFNRNLMPLAKLTKNHQVIIVASEYLETNYELVEILSDSGCKLFRGYFQNIEEFYQLSDCYMFPTIPGNSISCPLSILEAMSCNLPVVSTKFDGISSFFDESEGLYFIDQDSEIDYKLEKIKCGLCNVNTRKKIERYSWKDISNTIIDVYRAL